MRDDNMRILLIDSWSLSRASDRYNCRSIKSVGEEMNAEGFISLPPSLLIKVTITSRKNLNFYWKISFFFAICYLLANFFPLASQSLQCHRPTYRGRNLQRVGCVVCRSVNTTSKTFKCAILKIFLFLN